MNSHLPHQKCPPGSKEQVHSTDSKEAVVREACISLEEAINQEVVEVAVVTKVGETEEDIIREVNTYLQAPIVQESINLILRNTY